MTMVFVKSFMFDTGLRVAPLDQVIRSPYESGGFLFGGIMAGESLMLAEIKYLQSENQRSKTNSNSQEKNKAGSGAEKPHNIKSLWI
jgi:hypothetical protein